MSISLNSLSSQATLRSTIRIQRQGRPRSRRHFKKSIGRLVGHGVEEHFLNNDKQTRHASLNLIAPSLSLARRCAILTRYAHLLQPSPSLQALLRYQRAVALSPRNFYISHPKMLISLMLLLHEPVIQRLHFSLCSRHTLTS